MNETRDITIAKTKSEKQLTTYTGKKSVGMEALINMIAYANAEVLKENNGVEVKPYPKIEPIPNPLGEDEAKRRLNEDWMMLEVYGMDKAIENRRQANIALSSQQGDKSDNTAKSFLDDKENERFKPENRETIKITKVDPNDPVYIKFRNEWMEKNGYNGKSEISDDAFKQTNDSPGNIMPSSKRSRTSKGMQLYITLINRHKK